MKRLMLLLSLAIALPVGLSALKAQDFKPDPADAKAVKAVMKTAVQALLDKDAETFVDCCDPYVDCFFADGTLVKGKATITQTLNTYFANRAEGVEIKPDVVPRSYRVLSDDIITVDWPATITTPTGDEIVLNTMTTLRETDGQWFITSYLESVPFPKLRANGHQSRSRR